MSNQEIFENLLLTLKNTFGEPTELNTDQMCDIENVLIDYVSHHAQSSPTPAKFQRDLLAQLHQTKLYNNPNAKHAANILLQELTN